MRAVVELRELEVFEKHHCNVELLCDQSTLKYLLRQVAGDRLHFFIDLILDWAQKVHTRVDCHLAYLLMVLEPNLKLTLQILPEGNVRKDKREDIRPIREVVEAVVRLFIDLFLWRAEQLH